MTNEQLKILQDEISTCGVCTVRTNVSDYFVEIWDKTYCLDCAAGGADE